MELDAIKNVERLRKIREDRIQSIEMLISWEEAERRKFR
jgi:hypothetical protein